jgi:hypothetical protein
VADEALQDFYTQRLGALRSDRGNFNTQWEEAAALVIPAHRDSFTGLMLAQNVQGQKKTELQFDSTAAFSAQRFASVIESLVTPQASIWHLLKAVDPMLRKKRAVREFFDALSETLYNYRYRPIANFVGNSQQVYQSLGVYGNGVLYVDRPDRNKGLRYKNVHLGEAYFVENHAGKVDTMYRAFSLDSRQMVQRFGDACPKEVADDAKLPMSNRKWQMLHVVHPRDDYVPGYIGAQGMAFKSCYILVDTKALLREGGYASFPYAVTRYTQASGEVYGRGPAQWVLPAIKVLNQEKKTMLEQGHRQVAPVLLAHDDGNLGSFSMRPGTLNAGGVSAEGRPLVHALPVGNLAVNEKMMDMEKAVIKDAFLISLFEILVEDRKEMTATEVLERAREKGMLLAPTAGRIESEFLGPLLEREIDLLQQQGLMPPMPPILQQANAEYRIEYDSPMSRMRRAEKVSGFLRSLDQAANYTRLTGDPSPLDWYAFDRAMPEIQDILGAPVGWTSTEDEVAAKRQQRSQQQQIQQLTAAAPALATVQKQLPNQTA